MKDDIFDPLIENPPEKSCIRKAIDLVFPKPTFEQEVDMAIKLGFIKPDFTPLKCPHCEFRSFSETNHDTIAGHICEYTLVCNQCEKTVAYWAYGHFQP